MTEQNIYYMAVARSAGEGIVVAEYSNDCEVDVDAVGNVLEDPSMKISPGKHYSFTVGDQQAWHLIGDHHGMIYILITQPDYKSKAAYVCLEEMQRQYITLVGDACERAKAHSHTAPCL